MGGGSPPLKTFRLLNTGSLNRHLSYMLGQIAKVVNTTFKSIGHDSLYLPVSISYGFSISEKCYHPPPLLITDLLLLQTGKNKV